jgi:hypothetical protein
MSPIIARRSYRFESRAAWQVEVGKSEGDDVAEGMLVGVQTRRQPESLCRAQQPARAGRIEDTLLAEDVARGGDALLRHSWELLVDESASDLQGLVHDATRPCASETARGSTSHVDQLRSAGLVDLPFGAAAARGAPNT